MERFGLYLAVVSDNADPDRLGRVKVHFPWSEQPDTAIWAAPCLSPVQMRAMKIFVPPDAGDAVWVMFEAGDPTRPVWMGCAWTPTTRDPPGYWEPV